MLRFDEQVARDALAKLDTLIDLAEMVGWDKVIERQDKASFCFDCKKYEQDDNDVTSLI
jgi:adenine deaminase